MQLETHQSSQSVAAEENPICRSALEARKSDHRGSLRGSCRASMQEQILRNAINFTSSLIVAALEHTPVSKQSEQPPCFSSPTQSKGQVPTQKGP